MSETATNIVIGKEQSMLLGEIAKAHVFNLQRLTRGEMHRLIRFVEVAEHRKYECCRQWTEEQFLRVQQSSLKAVQDLLAAISEKVEARV